MAKLIKNDSLAYGKNSVLSALEAGIVQELYVLDSFKDERIEAFVKQNKVPVKIVNKKEINSFLSVNHQGVIAKVESFKFTPLQTLFTKIQNVKDPIVLLLDEISDPHNFGAIIRSAEAFGVQAIIIKKDRQVTVNPTVMKVATGAQNKVMICEVANLNNALQELKKNGFWVVSTALDTKQNVSDLKYDFKVALVVGNEGKGVSSLVLKNSDYVVKIPMLGTINSLNVSVATGVVLGLIRKIQLYL